MLHTDRLSGDPAGVLEPGVSDFARLLAECMGDLPYGGVCRQTALFDQEVRVGALAGWLVSGYLLDDEVLVDLLDHAADTGKIRREIG